MELVQKQKGIGENMKRVKNEERKNEIERDAASRFVAEQYVSKGYYLHFHRNLEIYGVVKGKVAVTIAGECLFLTEGQIAIIDGLENHSYEIDGDAEVFFFHIGTRYLRNFFSLYPNKRLPHWLLNVEYNKVLYERIKKVMGVAEEELSELKRIGITCQLFSDIIEHYGVKEKEGNVTNNDDMITEIVQYIYEHYNENITLETLSKVFYISPKALSKKISKRLNVDLRVFINDIRVQRAVQMLEDPENKNKSLDDIAAMCGFNNMGTFYRSYERNFKYRKLDKE